MPYSIPALHGAFILARPSPDPKLRRIRSTGQSTNDEPVQSFRCSCLRGVEADCEGGGGDTADGANTERDHPVARCTVVHLLRLAISPPPSSIAVTP